MFLDEIKWMQSRVKKVKTTVQGRTDQHRVRSNIEQRHVNYDHEFCR